MLDLDLVYKEYAEFVYKYVMSLCNDKDTAEELLQETFYQAVRSAHNYNGTCKISTWLCQIAKHLWYQELRKRKQRDINTHLFNIMPDEISLEQRMCQKEEALEVYRRIHMLGERDKEIFMLRVMGELSFQEIGTIFDKTENWARVTFYRIKQKIIKGWDEYEM